MFCNLTDPVGAGLVDSQARPGGNATGFIQFEYTLSAKWLELLKQIAPGLVRVAVLRDAEITADIGQFAVIQSVASALGVEVSAINMSDAGEMERAVNSFAQLPNGGLILTTSAKAVVHRDLIVALAARHKLPMITYRRYYVVRGALVSYGYDILEQFRLAAGYVDRILRGAKPAELTVQAPTKYELVINLKTAKALGLSLIQPTLLYSRRRGDRIEGAVYCSSMSRRFGTFRTWRDVRVDLLSEVERKSLFGAARSAFDPQATFATICCDAA